MADVPTSSGRRTVAMQVLVLGLCRTGTQSIVEALELLGYTGIYHMREVAMNNQHDFWLAALEAKFDQGKPFTREKWDTILGNYMGVADIPTAIFAEELIAAYPDAKIILSTRKEDKWYDSMMTTIWPAYAQGLSPPLEHPRRRLADKYHQVLWKGDFPAYGREAFRRHNARVRQVAPKDRFLEYEVQQGWAPLCEFLGKAVPERDFPKSDVWAHYKKTGSLD